MAIPQVPEQNPGQTPFILPRIANPFLSIWWSTQTVTNVPENVMGWLVAQGYEITGISQDTTTVPPTNYFALTREGMQPLEVILALCNSYTIAANEARYSNQGRYNEIVINWTQLIETTHDHFNNQTAEQNAQAGVFIADLDEYMTAIEDLIEENRSQMVADALEAKLVLQEMDGRLADLESNAASNALTITDLLADQTANLQNYITGYDSKLVEMDTNVSDHIASVLDQISNLDTILDAHIADYSSQFDQLALNYSAHLSDIDALLAAMESNLDDYTADVEQILTSLQTDFDAVNVELTTFKDSSGTLVADHVVDYEDILDDLEVDFRNNSVSTRTIVTSLYSDFTAHEPATEGLLEGLGVTDLARINEEFASKLSVQLQDLVDRGLSEAAIITDITERNHRDRDEQIQLLNDRLNREKFENKHRLYEQHRGIRGTNLDNEHRLYEQQVAMRARTLDGKSQIHSVRQEVLRYQATLVNGIYALLQEVRNRTLSGKQAIFSAVDAIKRYNIEVKSSLYAQLQDVRQRAIESVDRIYQLRDVFAKWENSETHRTYEQLQQIEQLFLDCVQRQLAAKQDVTRNEMSQQDNLLQQAQSALTSLIGGKERFSTLLLQNASTLAEHKHRAIVERMNTATQRLDGWKSIADENRALMAYQIDERNKLLVGLYSFVERRDDIGPEWSQMASMIAGLGDSGGGWIQP